MMFRCVFDIVKHLVFETSKEMKNMIEDIQKSYIKITKIAAKNKNQALKNKKNA